MAPRGVSRSQGCQLRTQLGVLRLQRVVLVGGEGVDIGFEVFVDDDVHGGGRAGKSA